MVSMMMKRKYTMIGRVMALEQKIIIPLKDQSNKMTKCIKFMMRKDREKIRRFKTLKITKISKMMMKFTETTMKFIGRMMKYIGKMMKYIKSKSMKILLKRTMIFNRKLMWFTEKKNLLNILMALIILTRTYLN